MTDAKAKTPQGRREARRANKAAASQPTTSTSYVEAPPTLPEPEKPKRTRRR